MNNQTRPASRNPTFRVVNNVTRTQNAPATPAITFGPKQNIPKTPSVIVLEPTVTPKQNVAHEPKGARLPIPNSKKAASDIDELLDSYRNLTNEENEILGELQKLRLKRQSLLKKGKQMQEDQLWKLSEQLDKERTGRTQLEQRLTRLEAQLHLLTAANSPKSDVVGTTAGLPITTTSSAIVSNSSATTSLSTADNNRSSSSFKVVASGSSK